MPKLLAIIVFAMLAAGCAAIYKVDVYQGNLLEEQNVAQLKPGLTKRQVLLLAGSPSVRDPFHQQRWDYVASVRKRGGTTEVKNLTLHFENDVLARVEGDYFAEQDEALAGEMRRYGNLPREDKNKRRAGR